MKLKSLIFLLILAGFIMAIGCGKKPPPPPPPPIAVAPETTVTPPLPPPPCPPLQLASIFFDFDRYNIRPDAQVLLSQNGKSLMENPTVTIRIEGNCDERGTEQYNLALGSRRAQSAKDYLVTYGIDASRMTTISYGKERPLALGHNEAAWAKNRRDDFVVTSEQK
jgi:peptidoglycan-associated lipoprotein